MVNISEPDGSDDAVMLQIEEGVEDLEVVPENEEDDDGDDYYNQSDGSV